MNEKHLTESDKKDYIAFGYDCGQNNDEVDCFGTAIILQEDYHLDEVDFEIAADALGVCTLALADPTPYLDLDKVKYAIKTGIENIVDALESAVSHPMKSDGLLWCGVIEAGSQIERLIEMYEAVETDLIAEVIVAFATGVKMAKDGLAAPEY